MEWRSEGIVLGNRPHGENAAIIEVLTPAHGRHAGVVRGGTSQRTRPILQPGNLLDLTWRARLPDHMGAFSVELVRSRSAVILASRMALAGTNALTAMLMFCLPERLGCPRLYARTSALLDLLEHRDLWPLAYVQWEFLLLEELGFGLDLGRCAVTGADTEPLPYISPRTGRAVSARGAGDWADRLLPLPACLSGQGEASPDDLRDGLRVTGHFLTRHVAEGLRHAPLPPARSALVDLITGPRTPDAAPSLPSGSGSGHRSAPG